MSLERLVYDHLDPCPYLPDRMARMPLRYPADGELSAKEFDARLSEGDRRTGPFLYRASCPTCRACEPIRLVVNEFHPNQTQRRVWRKGTESLQTSVGPARVSAERVALFNAHRNERGLSRGDCDIDEAGYAAFLAETCVETFEIQYRIRSGTPHRAFPTARSSFPTESEQLVAVAICDQGRESLSAVYCYYDPDAAYLSPGVFSILTQIELCRARALCYLYLGLYIAESPHMNYKARYLPHERLIEGEWRRFEKHE